MSERWSAGVEILREAVPMGSKRIGRHGAKPVILDVKDRPLRSFQEELRWAMREKALPEPVEGPVSVTVYLEFPRPRCHYGTGKNASRLRPTAPRHHSNKPDVDKCLRAILDAGSGIWWRDDCKAVRVSIEKFWGATGRTQVFCEALG